MNSTLKKVTIHLLIDQNIPADKVDQEVNAYLDLLAETEGNLTWGTCTWETEDSEITREVLF